VEEAIDGEKGMHLAQMAAVPHDAVLMDMRMPVMDGVETTREMRARGYTRPIIALTANAFSREVEACLAAGMNACLTKPMKINDLIDLLRRHCV
jgi:CheY-like chemotaxis protein